MRKILSWVKKEEKAHASFWLGKEAFEVGGVASMLLVKTFAVILALFWRAAEAAKGCLPPVLALVGFLAHFYLEAKGRSYGFRVALI